MHRRTSAVFSLADARDLVAREYGFDDWDALRTEVEPAATHTARSKVYDAALPPDHEFFKAVARLDLDRVRELLSQDPSLANADVRGIAAIRPHWGWSPRPGEILPKVKPPVPSTLPPTLTTTYSAC